MTRLGPLLQPARLLPFTSSCVADTLSQRQRKEVPSNVGSNTSSNQSCICHISLHSHTVYEVLQCSRRLLQGVVPVLQRGKQFADTSTRARQTIAELGARFVRHDAVVMVHGFSRVALALLQQVAESVSQAAHGLVHVVSELHTWLADNGMYVAIAEDAKCALTVQGPQSPALAVCCNAGVGCTCSRMTWARPPVVPLVA